MRHGRVGALITAMVTVLALASPVGAAGAEPVTIELHADFETGETFTASGFCESGTAETFDFRQAGVGRSTTFHLFKELTCDDGSGTLVIRVNASLVFGTPGTIGGWNVADGTGNYAGTHGGGKIVGTGFEGGIDDLYTGMLTG